MIAIIRRILKGVEKVNTKLTLKLDKNIIERAKIYAKLQKTSLSNLVENYFRSISSHGDNSDLDLSPIVQELSGIIDLPEDFDIKEEYAKYLTEKYS